MSVSAFISLALAAILAENVVLTRFLGVEPLPEGTRKLSGAAAMGLTVTVFMGLAALVTWPVDALVLAPLGLTVLRTAVFAVTVAALAWGAEGLLKRAAPALGKLFGAYLPLILTNSAVLGALLLGVGQGYGFVETVAYSVLAGLGFTLAAVLLAGVRERLAYSDIPKAFEGLPILLVTAGLLAMVFLGFSGLTLG